MRILKMKTHASILPLVVAVALFLAVVGIPCAQAQKVAGPNRPSTVPAGYIVTPFGYFHPSCVRGVASGETVLPDGRVQHQDGTVDDEVPVCNYPHYTSRGEMIAAGASGLSPLTITHSWIEDGATTTTSAYGKLTATWPVPSAPTTYHGQTVYLFPGLVDYQTDATIIQPVLGWNSFFGQVWSIASWNCCPGGTSNYSSPVQVNTGDTIYGVIKSTCKADMESCATWNVTTKDKTTNQSTVLRKTPSEGQVFNWAQSGALEVYEIVECSDYPPENATTFSKVAIFDDNFKKIANPGWSFTDYYDGLNPQCNYGGQIETKTTILYY